MIAVVERVSSAKVFVQGENIGSIEKGLLVLLGVDRKDEQSDLDYIVNKTAGLRIFAADGKMTQSVLDVGGQILVVSQFTLLGDARKGRRPDFMSAAKADKARIMYESCIDAFREKGIITRTGEFGADMQVCPVCDGPVTILLDSKRRF